MISFRYGFDNYHDFSVYITKYCVQVLCKSNGLDKLSWDFQVLYKNNGLDKLSWDIQIPSMSAYSWQKICLMIVIEFSFLNYKVTSNIPVEPNYLLWTLGPFYPLTMWNWDILRDASFIEQWSLLPLYQQIDP